MQVLQRVRRNRPAEIPNKWSGITRNPEAMINSDQWQTFEVHINGRLHGRTTLCGADDIPRLMAEFEQEFGATLTPLDRRGNPPVDCQQLTYRYFHRYNGSELELGDQTWFGPEAQLLHSNFLRTLDGACAIQLIKEIER